MTKFLVLLTAKESRQITLDRLKNLVEAMNLLSCGAIARVVVCDKCQDPYIMVGNEAPDYCPDCRPAQK